MEVVNKTEYIDISVNTSNNTLTCEHCDSRDTKKDDIFKCHMCCKEFRSICCLHNHLMDCIKSRSYIYDDSNKTAYPFLDSFDNLRSDEVGDNAVPVDKDETPSKINPNNPYVNLKERMTPGKMIVEVDIVKDSKPSDMYELWLEFYKAYTTKAKGHQTVSNTFDDAMNESEDTDDYDFEKSFIPVVKKGKRKSGCPRQLKRKTKRKRPSKLDKLEDTEQFVKTITVKEEPCELLGQVNPKIETEQEAEYNMYNNSIKKFMKDIYCDENVDNIKQEKNECFLDKISVSESDINGKNSTEGENADKTNETALKKSTKRNRKRDSMIKCNVCDKLINYVERKRHAIGHQDAHPFACKLCPKSYKHRKHLSMHMHSHNDVLPYYCHICGMGFVAAYRLKEHMWVHAKPEDKPLVCTVCDKRFSMQSKLNKHMRSHSGVKSHICDLCGNSFTRLENLRAHILGIHKKVKRFTCEECNDQFATNYLLQCHIKKHTGERPFKCLVCGADFILRRELRRHMEMMHQLSLEGQAIDNEKITINLMKQTVMETLEVQNAVNQLNEEPPIIFEPYNQALSFQ